MALTVWKQFPTEIAHDLSAIHHRNIREWHQGTMTSREFLELVEYLPDSSAFKTGLRRGDWSDEEYRQARLVNEMALSRADNSGYQPHLVQSPLNLHLEAALEDYRAVKHDETLNKLKGGR